MLIDNLLEWATHPAVVNTVGGWLAKQSGQTSETVEAYERLQAQLDRIEAQTTKKPGGRPPGSKNKPKASAMPSFTATATSGPSLTVMRDKVMATSGALKEALRFAREDGIQHPEAQQRIQDAQAWLLSELPALERFDLAPERLATLPPAERQVWEATLPTIRKLRQAGLNKIGTAEGLEEAAALAGTLGTQLQVAAVATGAQGPGWTPPPSEAQSPVPPPQDGPYSQYAPEMSIDTGCVECGRGHLVGVDAVLAKATEDAAVKGADHPDVQARLAFAQEELAALFQYDWTPEKIARNPETERKVLEQFRPQVEALFEASKRATTPEALKQVAQQAHALRTAYDQALPANRTYHAVVKPGQPPAGGHETVRVDKSRVFKLHQPTAGEVKDTTRMVNAATAYDRLALAVEGCGVPIRYRALPATPEYILEGQYNPDTNSIQLAPAALSKDSYAVQTLIHESLHSLLQNPTCLPHPPADHSTAERQVEDGVIATMVQAGLPLETRDGTVIDPGGRTVDWSAIEAEWGHDATTNLKWATDWVLEALAGDIPTCQTCPIPQV
ncbi:hypothetical protein [Sulfobacillus harzensis]|uniref:Uncharacterized protein n=1 Tax=Sulfobacillus harzensis TaxID=2729629 RepID=A0A7Y0L2P6_9FIRM|nr:hypothetical protein [Sulfobacillus harzensis]NMP22199.1 hypothetical protein [Sulfobacillus harzensis]